MQNDSKKIIIGLLSLIAVSLIYIGLMLTPHPKSASSVVSQQVVYKDPNLPNPNDPVYQLEHQVAGEEKENYVGNAKTVFSDYLAKQGGLYDLRIEGVYLVVAKSKVQGDAMHWFTAEDSKDAFVAQVYYSVKPIPTIVNASDWAAGNGDIRDDGWIVDKESIVSFDFDVEKQEYEVTSFGTGPLY